MMTWEEQQVILKAAQECKIIMSAYNGDGDGEPVEYNYEVRRYFDFKRFTFWIKEEEDIIRTEINWDENGILCIKNPDGSERLYSQCREANGYRLVSIQFEDEKIINKPVKNVTLIMLSDHKNAYHYIKATHAVWERIK